MTLLRDLVAKFDARDAALREEFAAFEAERARWNGYYSARRTRAQIECSITQIGARPTKGEAMKYSCGCYSLVMHCAAGLIGQTGRDAYRQAYDVWQQAQANLERDAGAGGRRAGRAGGPLRSRGVEFRSHPHRLPEILRPRTRRNGGSSCRLPRPIVLAGLDAAGRGGTGHG